jgi:hypothetical protein
MDVSLESTRKKLKLNNLSLYTVLQILSISIVDKKPILRAFDDLSFFPYKCESDMQLSLWGLFVESSGWQRG